MQTQLTLRKNGHLQLTRVIALSPGIHDGPFASTEGALERDLTN